MKKKWIISFALVLFLILVWPTAFRYEHAGDSLVRINRLTGNYEVFQTTSEIVTGGDEQDCPQGIAAPSEACGCVSPMSRAKY
jgi:hypothetical protein